MATTRIEVSLDKEEFFPLLIDLLSKAVDREVLPHHVTQLHFKTDVNGVACAMYATINPSASAPVEESEEGEG